MIMPVYYRLQLRERKLQRTGATSILKVAYMIKPLNVIQRL